MYDRNLIKYRGASAKTNFPITEYDAVALQEQGLAEKLQQGPGHGTGQGAGSGRSAKSREAVRGGNEKANAKPATHIAQANANANEAHG